MQFFFYLPQTREAGTVLASATPKMAPQSLSPKTASLDPSQVPLTPNLEKLDFLQCKIET